MAQQALESYGFKMCEKTADIFKRYARRTMKAFSTPTLPISGRPVPPALLPAFRTPMAAAASSGTTAGGPVRHGQTDCRTPQGPQNREHSPLTDELIRLREEMSEQIRALEELAQLGASYGCDLTRPAANAREAVQWTYLGYLAAVKEQNGSGHVPGPRFHFLRHLFHPRPGTGAHHGRGSSGNHRPVRDEAAHRPFHPHA